MTEGETGRLQDQGRDRRRRGSPSAATVALQARWYAQLRVELEAIIAELAGPAGQTTIDGTAPTLPLERRDKLVKLGVAIAAALGTEVDVPAPQRAPTRRKGPVRVDFG